LSLPTAGTTAWNSIRFRGPQGLALAGVILQRIFEHNQAEFTRKDPRGVPVIAVIEEAQSVLGSTAGQGEGPFVSWVKEGRKYDLGAVIVTQQPSSIPAEILSQGDNWFVFHLLAEGDLRALQKANAHFSDDLLSSLLNEPLPGHGVFWSSVSDTPYPIPVRALLFEKSFEPLDPLYVRPAADCYASRLRSRLRSALDEAVAAQAASPSRPARAWTPPRPSPARPSAGWPGMSSSRPPCERAGASGGGSSSTSWPSACLARSARIIRSGSIGSISTAS